MASKDILDWLRAQTAVRLQQTSTPPDPPGSPLQAIQNQSTLQQELMQLLSSQTHAQATNTSASNIFLPINSTQTTGGLGGTTSSFMFPWQGPYSTFSPLFQEPWMSYYTRLVEVHRAQIERLVREAQERNDKKSLEEELAVWELGREPK